MNLSQIRFICLVGVPALLVQACGSSGSGVTIAPVTPIVKSALPSGLVPSGANSTSRAMPRHQHAANRSFTPTTEMNSAATYITRMFQNYYAVGLGANIQGYIMAQAAVIDGRTSLYSGATTKDHACLGATTSPFTLDFSSFNPNDSTATNMMKFTLAGVSCTAAFSGTSGANGSSGEVFGVNGATSTSEWVTVTDMAGDPLQTGSLTSMILANVTNTDTTTEAVDALAISYNGTASSPASNGKTFAIARFKGVPSTSNFEMYYVGNQLTQGSFKGPNATDGNGNPINMGAGYRLISDGTNIYADGLLCTDTSSTNSYANCSGSAATVTNSGTLAMTVAGNAFWKIFQVCLDAKTLAVVDPVATTNCLALANKFTLSPNATAFTTGSTMGVFNGPAASPVAVTQDTMLVANITGDNTITDIFPATMTVPPTAQLNATALTALTNSYKISGASTVTTTY